MKCYKLKRRMFIGQIGWHRSKRKIGINVVTETAAKFLRVKPKASVDKKED